MTGPVLITGATSGIGAAFARALARRGHDLILAGRRLERLEALAADLRRDCGVAVRVQAGDLTREADVAALEEIIAQTPDLAVLVNNAGFGLEKDFIGEALGGHLAMIAVHATAAVRLTYAALPRLVARGEGALIFTSSVAAFLPTPDTPLYSATKSFLNYFAESLHAKYGRAGLRVQALCPGFTHTEFHERIGMPRDQQVTRGAWRWMEPDQIVAASLRDLDRGRFLCVPGPFYQVMVWLARTLPRPVLRLLTGLKRRLRTRGGDPAAGPRSPR